MQRLWLEPLRLLTNQARIEPPVEVFPGRLSPIRYETAIVTAASLATTPKGEDAPIATGAAFDRDGDGGHAPIGRATIGA